MWVVVTLMFIGNYEERVQAPKSYETTLKLRQLPQVAFALISSFSSEHFNPVKIART